MNGNGNERPIWLTAPRQNRTWQKNIIEAALKQQDTANLCWYVEYVPPVRLRKDDKDRIRMAQLYGWVPVVPVGNAEATGPAAVDMAWASMEIAGILSLWLESRYGCNGSDFMPVLSQYDTLNKFSVPWFLWGWVFPWYGDKLDDVCATCGGLAPCYCQDRRLGLVGAGEHVHLARAGRLYCGETSAQWHWAHDMGDVCKDWALEPVTCPGCRQEWIEREAKR